MATTFASHLAASLPAPAAPAPAAPTLETLPASMAKVIDIEAEIPLSTVQIDGLVATKIIKHSLDLLSSNAHGLLLGLDLDGTLEVSNSFPLPNHSSEEDDKSAKSVGRYQGQMLRSLKEVGSVDSVVGFYQATRLGAFLKQPLVEAQAVHQEKLRHGGIVVIHDTSKTARGNASFRAFRLTKAFVDAFRRNNFSTASLIDHRLTFSTVLEEIPVEIRTNALLNSFLGALKEPHRSAILDAPPSEATTSAIPPSYLALNLGSTGLTKNLTRQIAREKSKADAYVSKRKEENAARVGQGLAPLPEENVNRLFKIPPEPSRLESMLLLGQMDGYSQSLGATSSTGLVTMYAAKASSGI